MIVLFSTWILLILSCAPVYYNTFYEGGRDPLFDFSNIKTIGFSPWCWTDNAKSKGMDELAEKRLYVLAKTELEKRGFRVFFISPEFLEEDDSLNAIYVKQSYENMPDLTLTLYYRQQLGKSVKIPGKSSGMVNWRDKQGRGFYTQREGYEIQTCSLLLVFTLWSGSPKYMNKVWEGACIKGSSKFDLFDQAPEMTKEIFLQKFDH